MLASICNCVILTCVKNVKFSLLNDQIKAVGFALVAFILTGAQPLTAQVVPPGTNNTSCLVYNTRDQYSSTGYASYSGNSSGLMVLNRQRIVTASTFGTNGPANLTVRDGAQYALWTYNKTNYFERIYWQDGTRVVGLVNMARSNAATPTYLLSMGLAYSDESLVFAASSLSDSDLIGRPVLKSPNKGSAPIWLATTLASTSKSYSLNPDITYDDQGNPSSPIKFLGQNNTPRRAILDTLRTTYSFNASLSELVKANQSLEDALQTIEAWLKSKAGGSRVEVETEVPPM